jgi:hypothetical protein
MNMIKNVNHLPLILQQNDNERFRARVKNPRQLLWLFKTKASGDSCFRITNPSIAVRDCKSRTVGIMKAPDSIQAIPEVQRTFFIFSSTCRRGEDVEQRDLYPENSIIL